VGAYPGCAFHFTVQTTTWPQEVEKLVWIVCIVSRMSPRFRESGFPVKSGLRTLVIAVLSYIYCSLVCLASNNFTHTVGRRGYNFRIIYTSKNVYFRWHLSKIMCAIGRFESSCMIYGYKIMLLRIKYIQIQIFDPSTECIIGIITWRLTRHYFTNNIIIIVILKNLMITET